MYFPAHLALLLSRVFSLEENWYRANKTRNILSISNIPTGCETLSLQTLFSLYDLHKTHMAVSVYLYSLPSPVGLQILSVFTCTV